MNKTSKKFYIAFVSLLLVVPLALMPFFYQENEADIEDMDKRYATSFSDVYHSTDRLGTFESWFSDHLAFRKTAISAFAHLNVTVGVSNNPEYVVLGQDGWMFLGNIHAGKIDQYRRIIDYRESQIETDIERISALNTYLNDQDIAFLFAVPPNKENVYPEHAPEWLTVDDMPKYAESFKAFGGTDLIDELYPDIMTAKAEYGDILYPKTDAHWTALGAYFGYQSILESLNTKNGTVFQPLALVSYEIVQNDGYELTKALGYAGSYNDFETLVTVSPESEAEMTYLTENTTWQGLRHFENKDALNRASVLLIGDSFSSRLSPYFESSFSDYYFVHYSMVFGDSDGAQALNDVIAMTKPDVVILEIIERHLPSSISLLPEVYPAQN